MPDKKPPDASSPAPAQDGPVGRAAAPIAAVAAVVACAVALVLKAPAGLIASAAVCLSAAALALLWQVSRRVASGQAMLAERLEILTHLRAAAPASGAMPTPAELEDNELARLAAECQAEIETRRSRPEHDQSLKQARQAAALKGARLSVARAAAAERAEAAKLPAAKIKRT